jgi:prepilin-type N-terminal cleavage/methylation domain-containing protein
MKRSKAFTLLEMMVAMVILATILAGVYGAFHTALQASRRALPKGDSVQNMLARLNILASEMRNALIQNDVLLTGTSQEVYFYVPMRLKDTRDILPLYRVHYWFEARDGKKGTVYRSTVPWIKLQKPDLRPLDIERLENKQRWMGPVEDFRITYAVVKKGLALAADPFVAIQTRDDAGEEVQENADLLWKETYSAKSHTPYGVRMQWKQVGEKGETVPFSIVFWPALGLYQQETTDTNVAPASGEQASEETERS